MSSVFALFYSTENKLLLKVDHFVTVCWKLMIIEEDLVMGNVLSVLTVINDVKTSYTSKLRTYTLAHGSLRTHVLDT